MLILSIFVATGLTIGVAIGLTMINYILLILILLVYPDYFLKCFIIIYHVH